MSFSTEQLLDAFFILSFGTPLALLISFWLVGRFLWLPMKEEYAKHKLEKIIIPYINRYPFNPEDPVTDCSGVILDSLMTVEDTDSGLVIMHYKKNSFEYWADSTPQYRTLEAVARKFATCFRCEHLYIHRLYELHKKYMAKIKRDEEESKKKAEEEKKEKAAPKQKKNDDSIFAVFKKSPPKPKKADNVIVCDKSNTFIKRGRLCECTLFQPEKEKKEERSFNFSDWKKIKFS